MSDKPQETRIDDVEDLKTHEETGSVRLPVPSNDPNDPLVSHLSRYMPVMPLNPSVELAFTCQGLGLSHGLLLHLHRQCEW
jgi:hypothetical protein